MGKLILCCGNRTKRPYVLPIAGIRVYSIEELCYYICHYISFIEEDMFSDSLIDWIANELNLTQRAEKLRLLKEKGTDLKTLATVVLCSSDYYSENEIKASIKIIDEMTVMSPIKKCCIRANRYLDQKQYREASAEYERILNLKELDGLTPEDYGDILHNYAVARAHTVGLREAADSFMQAYRRNHKRESLKQYFYALYLTEDREVLEKKLNEYRDELEDYKSIVLHIEKLASEAEHSGQMQAIHKLDRYKVAGRFQEYYSQINDIINTWKSDIRQI